MWGTSTLFAGLFLVVCAGICTMAVSELSKNSLVRYVIGPSTGFIIGAALVFVLYLLLSLRLQRDDLREEIRRRKAVEERSQEPAPVIVHQHFEAGSNPHLYPYPPPE